MFADLSQHWDERRLERVGDDPGLIHFLQGWSQWIDIGGYDSAGQPEL
jgi:hypothetical protein